MNVCALMRGGKCSSLRRKNCNGCTFFKTEKQLREGRQKARERLEALPDDDKKWIKDKYYRGPASREEGEG